jgi:hypothetical protein
MKILKSIIVSLLCYLSLLLFFDILLIVADFTGNDQLRDVSISALKAITFV